MKRLGEFFSKILPYLIIGINISSGTAKMFQGKINEGFLYYVIAALFALMYFLSSQLKYVRTKWEDTIKTNRELLDLNIELLDKMVVMNKDLEEYSKPKEAENW